MKIFRLLVICIVLFAHKAAAAEINGMTVKSGETKIIENQELIVEGDVVLEPDSTLIIRNSDVTINSHYKNQYWVRVKDSARLIVENSILREGPVPNLGKIGKFGKIGNFRLGETVIELENNAAVTLINSTSELRIGPGDNSSVSLESSYLSILFWRTLPGARAKIKDSEIQLLHIWLHGKKEEKIKMHGLYPGKTQNLKLIVEGSALEINNSKIMRFAIALWIPPLEEDCNKNVVIENSDLAEIFAVFPKSTNIKIWNMKPGFHRDWNIYDSMNGTGLPWNLTLRNVNLHKWKLDFQGIAEIEDSKFHLDTWGNATVTVKNSAIVSNHHSRGGYVKLIDCTISDRPWHFTGVRFLYGGDVLKYTPHYVYEFQNTVVGPYAELSITDDRINIFFKGSVSFKLKPENIHWFGGTITREYSAIVLDKKQKAVPNQTVVLLDSEGKLIWEKATNENGLLYFNLTFNKDNYKKEFLLQTTINNSTITKKVGFFTETPVMLFKEAGVSKTWQFLAILIAVTLFIIFGKRVLRK